MQTHHSFVIPIFNEEAVIPELYRRFSSSVGVTLEKAQERYELVLVDDGSSDQSLHLITELHKKDPERIKVLSFSRNFGHQIAITAGIDFASGDTVTVLDADLQDPPEVILQMIDKWREGYDIVYGVRSKRKSENVFKKLTAHLFYRFLSSATRLNIPLDTGDFRLMSRKAADALRSMRERHRFVRGMAAWVGYRQTSVLYVREARFAGETKYPLKKMLRLAWDAFTGFSLVPLRLATYIGLFSAGLSLLVGIWALYIRFFTEESVQGWASLMTAILFLGGVQLSTIGILGEYIGRIFEEAKERPLYLLSQTWGFATNSPRQLSAKNLSSHSSANPSS